MINNGDSQMSLLPIFPEGGGDVCTQVTTSMEYLKPDKAMDVRNT